MVRGIDEVPRNVAIVVPRRAHAWRDRVWAALRPKWATLPWPLYEVQHEEGLFNRSWCVNRGAEQAGDWEVLVLIDADVHVPHAQVNNAVALAHQTDQMTVAFDTRIAIGEVGTRRILDGFSFKNWDRLQLDVRCSIHHGRCGASNHNSNSHCIAMPRGLWDEIEGFDERFEGWGFEDMSVLAATKTFRGEPNRIPGKAYHLYHPRALEREWAHSNYGVNEFGGRRYFEAEGDPVAMRKLIAERRTGAPLVPESMKVGLHQRAVEARHERRRALARAR